MHWGYFVLGTILCWGAYGPALHAGQMALGVNGKGDGVRALLWVGLSYCLVAVIVPGLMLMTKEIPGQFNMRGSSIATFAGILGALGAVGIIFAFRYGGSPAYVMPLVFGCAPLVNAIVSMIQHPPTKMPNPLFYVGMICAGLGAFLVLKFKPA